MYTVETTKDFDSEFKKLDNSVKKIISKWINKHLLNCENPRAYGKRLSRNLKQYWRYRIGNYRLLVEIKERELIIVAVSISHRKDVYESKNV